MITSVQKNFEKFLQKGDCVIVGVSGGPDSVALVRLLIEFTHKTPLKIIIAHINHGIRGRAANADQEFVKKLAYKFNLKFELKKVSLKGQSGVEEKGRKIRREFFEKLAAKYHAKYILTAHTADDQVETIVFNFLRGSGVRGLAGMALLKGKYLRPLLETRKKELIAFLKKLRQSYCRDLTNNDTELSRNFIRKKIIPQLEKINSAFRESILRNREVFYNLDVWLIAQARDAIEANSIFAKKLLSLPLPVQSTIIQEMYRNATKAHYGLPSTNVSQVLELARRNIGNKKVACPGKIYFFLTSGKLTAVQSR